MTTLDQLMKIGGVVAAGDFTNDGTLIDVRGQVSRT